MVALTYQDVLELLGYAATERHPPLFTFVETSVSTAPAAAGISLR